MSSTEEIKVKLSLKGAAQFSRDAERAARAVERIGRAARQANSSLRLMGTGLRGLSNATRQYDQAARNAERALGRLQRELDRAARSADRASNSARRSSASIGSLGSAGGRASSGLRSVGTAALGIGAGLAAAGIAAGVFGLKAGGQLEQAEIGFTTLLGSAEKAKSYMQDLSDFAMKTPFDFQGLSQNAKYLMAVGYSADETLPTLRALGDATAALNPERGTESIKSMALALGQMRTNGVLSLEEVGQLADANVNAYKYLSDASGKSVAKIRKEAEQGLISGKWASNTILKGLSEDPRFKGSMDKMAKSFLGQLANLKERIQLGAAKAFRPLSDELAKYIPGAAAVADRAMGWLANRIQYDLLPKLAGLDEAYITDGMDGLAAKIDENFGTDGKVSKAWEWLKNAFSKENLTRLKDNFVEAFHGIEEAAKAAYSILKGVGTVIGWFGVDTSSGWDNSSTKNAGKGSDAGVDASNSVNRPSYSNPLMQNNPLAPRMAQGGTVYRPGRVMVGERGREWLTLPKGAHVQPLSTTKGGSDSASNGDVVIMPGAIQISGVTNAEAKRLTGIVIDELKTKIARK